MLKNLKNKLKILINYPVHPQWLLKGAKKEIINLLNQIEENKTILDIGCYDKWTKQHCPQSCNYLGLDYYETAREWYETKPDIYGDALLLPILPQSVDVVLLIDVLEHIKNTDELLNQIHAVLKRGGILIISCPFLYPLHDQPRDFVRITEHGYKEFATRHGFNIEHTQVYGSSLITSALLLNIALTKTVINWLNAKHLLALTALLLPIIIIFINTIAKLISIFESDDRFMPISYLLKFKKQ